MAIITFNGESSKDYQVEVEHPPKYNFPEEDVEVVHVPGRNGDIIIRKGSYKNVKAEYELSSGDGETAQAVLARLITKWLHNGKNYCRLEDTYDPDIYRMASYKEAGSIENIYGLGARVTVNFDCKPQRWLKSGEEPITNIQTGAVITNPTDHNALPELKVTSYGLSHLNINGYQLDFKGLEITTTSSNIENLAIDIAKFMEEYPLPQGATAVALSVSDFGATAEKYEEDTGITDVTFDESTFMTKVTPTDEAIYIVIFTDAGILVSNLSANTIESVTITNAGYFDSYDPGEYVLAYGGNDNSFLVSSNASLQLTVNTVTYKNRFSSMPWEAYVSHVYTFSSSNNSWMDEDGHTIELSDYGISVSGTPANGDTITGGIYPTFTVEGKPDITEKIFDIVGYPIAGDSVTISKIVSKWAIYKNEDLLVDDIDISEYGIGVTGTPADGDSIVVTCKGVWKNTDQTAIDLNEVGITYSGFAKTNDEIDILIGRPIIIDSEAKDCYSEGAIKSNRNNDVTMHNGYPELSPGDNIITFEGELSVEVTPRWWTL